ncbi:phosphatase PAP2 family protein [Cupriavidus oxalaticus]|uniref:Membrane-associated phospholipid phosphatase, PAP2 superfamily n=1 Tax=Cupriavidus oxalaticus TaxID=96344 RepID=A0A976BEQ3_9BURK|nr:phosphatase PAP2 family protein [Cupriavidus oxalaticus]QRQ86711.1 phosphatase PAP2 family protein [Cupriavidus oxalaticus]QRQ94961.1 phosphatase PAP2 family protein [Cupriavidus oxalaticus]WQD83616.1 phosphatase PAP2 family protein [Cupriavidus oxalaticus]SPC16873.1 putative membrane-associated phospholipid phosphatase, PAP2 superfamily [Cupriavidus oxalaticus]
MPELPARVGAIADAWVTPGTVLGLLGLFTLATVLLLCLVPLLVALLRPLVRWLDGMRVWGAGALSARVAARHRPRRLSTLTLRVLERDIAELLLVLVAGAALLACGAALFWLAAEVVEGEEVVHLDQLVFAQLRAWRRDWLDVAMVAVTELGGARISVSVGVAVFAWLWWRRAWVTALYWAAALLGARACVMALKLGMARVRPASIYSGLESYSFPSGHATASMVTYGFLAFLLCLRQPWRVRIPVLALTAVAVAAIGVSRLYLGMHWLSDVAAGYALGLAWIALLGTAYHTLHVPAPRDAVAPWRLGAVAAAAVVAAFGYVAWFRMPDTLERYREAGAAAATVGAQQALLATAGAIPAAGRSCDGRCPALQSDSPPR